jgi:hypothetical protein
MNRRYLASLPCAIAILLSSGCAQLTGKVGGGQQALSSHGWTPLFNGRDLTGWETSGGAIFKVEDGCIVGTQGANFAPGDLFTTDAYSDFELLVTYRVVWPANSGVWFRYVDANKAYQADILEWKNPVAYSGSLYAPGKMFLAINGDKELEKRDGWNTIRIVAQGDHLQIWLNGKQTADVHDKDIASGRIGLQIHPGEQFGPMKITVREAKIRLPGK